MADEVGVRIQRRAGLVVEVVDDGVGGADWARGSGLGGLAARVEALGEGLRIDSPSGRRNASCPSSRLSYPGATA
jgi:signal transduction histidine kinase